MTASPREGEESWGRAPRGRMTHGDAAVVAVDVAAGVAAGVRVVLLSLDVCDALNPTTRDGL